MGWIELFTPPEWRAWSWRQRIAYVALLSFFLFVIGVFARWVGSLV